MWPRYAPQTSRHPAETEKASDGTEIVACKCIVVHPSIHTEPDNNAFYFLWQFDELRTFAFDDNFDSSFRPSARAVRMTVK